MHPVFPKPIGRMGPATRARSHLANVYCGSRQSLGQFAVVSPGFFTPFPHFGVQSVGLLTLFSPRLTSQTPSPLKGCVRYGRLYLRRGGG